MKKKLFLMLLCSALSILAFLSPGTPLSAQGSSKPIPVMDTANLNDADSATTASLQPVNILVKNQSQQAIEIVMDSNREVHAIPAGGAATFSPSILDIPTYHVFEVVNGQRGRKLYSKAFETVWFDPFPRIGDLRWTGAKLERD